MKNLFILLFFLATYPTLAQNLDSTRLFVPKHTFHGEIGGNNAFFASIHYNRIIRQYSQNQYLGYGVGVLWMPYFEALFVTDFRGNGSPIRFFDGLDWKRYNFTFSPYIFYMRRIKQSRSFLEFSAGYVFKYYYGRYFESITGTQVTYNIAHYLRTVDHNLFVGVGIRRQTKKGLFFRCYLLNYYELYYKRLETLTKWGGTLSSPNNPKQAVRLGLGIGIGKSFGN